MKKKYINPEIEVIKIQTMQMLAASDLLDISEEAITDEADLLAPEMDVFDIDVAGDITDFDNF